MKGLNPRFQAGTLASILALTNILTLSACGGGGGGGGGMVPGGPTPTPAPTPACTASNTVTPQTITTGAAVQASTANKSGAERLFARRVPSLSVARATESFQHAQYSPDLVEVVYGSAQLANVTVNLAHAEQNAGVLTVQSQLGFDKMGTIVRVVRVNSSDVVGTMDRLRTLPAVQTVARVAYRYLSTTIANFPNDPYYNGTNGTVSGTTTPPFYESPSKPGQWDMHMICASHAWGYAQSAGNSFGVTPGVLAGSEKIAIVDTGVDTTHPDLQGKIVYTATFVTTGGTTATCPGGLTMCDKDGHGTDVAGIAAADTNNAPAFGFAGTGYNAKIIAERVFPDPPSGGCPTVSPPSSCTATTTDIASAINDAVAHGANVINLSLGGGTCSGGNDPDPVEGMAVANAIASGRVVVAASGNGNSSGVGQSSLDSPACDTGVIAVGASAIADGQTNGSSKSGGTPTAAIEYVAGYSNFSTGNWGLVAPGGDPNGGTDNDDLHWIENIWTSTAADGSSASACATDFYGEVGNCRILIAGTSMATPHVAGVAAMMLGANSNLTPAQIFTDLCNGADSISDPHQGCGRLNAYRAVARALGDSTVP